MMRRLPRLLLNAATAVSAVLFVATAVAWAGNGRRGDAHPRPDFRDHSVQYWLGCGRTGFLIRRSDLRGPVERGPLTAAPNRDNWIQQVVKPETIEQAFPGVEIESFGAEVQVTYKQSRLEVHGASFVVRVRYWLVLCGTGLLPALYARRPLADWLRRRRSRPGLCPSCGYDLRATPDRCPECGTASGRSARPG